MLYIYNLRLPTEKAHGLQIVQNCEAFANEGLNVSLMAAKRHQAAEFINSDIFKHYQVNNNFHIGFLPSLDLLPFVPRRTKIINLILHIQQISFLISAFLYLIYKRHEIIYTRDHFLTILARLTNPRKKIVYEIHQKRTGKMGKLIQSLAIRLSDLAIPITDHMKDDLIKNIQAKGNYLVAHDGVKLERFEVNNTESKNDGLFYVGYVGSISVMGMDKGVTTLIKAINIVPNCRCILIGGRQQEIQKLLQFCKDNNIDTDKIIFIGHVEPNHVAQHLSEANAFVIPSPFNNFFAYYSSPLKLFEYMAMRKPIISSRLPAIEEIMTDEENILFFNPSDEEDLAKKISYLMDNPAISNSLAINSYDLLIEKYTWQKRAQRILNKLNLTN